MPGAPFVSVQLNDLSVDVSLSSVAQGDILCRGASKWNNLAAGTSGYFLKSNGPGANPSWAAVSVSPGGSSGQLQYNNAGAFGGLASTAVATSGNLITVTAQAATDVPFTVTGHASQSANLQTWKKGSSTVAYVSSSGYLLMPGGYFGATTGREGVGNGLMLYIGTHGGCEVGAGYSWFTWGRACFGPNYNSERFGIHVNNTANATPSVCLFRATANASQAGDLLKIVKSDDSTAIYRVRSSGDVIAALTSDTVGHKIVLYNGQSVDAFQILDYDGTTELFDLNKDGNPRVASTVFFEDTNGYISRTSVTNTMTFSASSATAHIVLTGNYLKVYTSNGIQLKADSDTTDGEIFSANKGGNSGTGLGLLLHGGNGSTSGTPTAGGYAKLYGGDGAAGNTNGGAAYVFGGAKFGSGSDGNVYLGYTGSAARGTVYTYGGLTFADANNMVFDTTTGTKIGTATGQKIGFWNATPVVQQVLATGGGATVDDVITLLQTLGLCKQS